MLKTQIHRISETSVSELQFEALERIFQESFFNWKFLSVMYGGSGARSESLFRSQCETRDLLLAFGSLEIL